MRIGRLLAKHNKNDLLRSWENSRNGVLLKTNDLLVVISRHPYDIIGMSTNRGWTTCHNIHDTTYGGHHLDGLVHDLSRGVLIAYLIRKDDMDIKNPISRMLINSKFVPDYDHVYGTRVKEFIDVVQNWCEDKNVDWGMPGDNYDDYDDDNDVDIFG